MYAPDTNTESVKGMGQELCEALEHPLCVQGIVYFSVYRLTVAITLSSTAIGVGKALTATVVRVA
jgi:hypothetical protein